MLYFLVFLSGFTGLVYEVTWQKYLTFYLGSHALSTSLILAVFFGFLSLGYYAIGALGRRFFRDKLMLYGVIEGVIGLYCLISPELFQTLFGFFQFPVSGGAQELGAGLLFASLFIGFPTFLMGGTIPALTQALSPNLESSARAHARIYGVNTFGAFVGTLLAGFVFIENWGLPLTLFYTSFINLFICFVTYLVAKRRPPAATPILAATPSSTPESSTSAPARRLLFVISFLSGFYVFSLENMLIRMAGVALGNSAYSFSIIVASFIFAMATGSLWLGYRQPRLGLGRFALLQAALAGSAVCLYLSIPKWPLWLLRVRLLFQSTHLNVWPYWFTVFTFFAIVLFVPVFLMGINLPLIFSNLRTRRQELADTVGRLYSVNSVGSVLGATIGGYLLFQFVPGEWVGKLTLALIVLSSVACAALSVRGPAARITIGVIALACLGGVAALPGWPPLAFSPGLFTLQNAGRHTTEAAQVAKAAHAKAITVYSGFGTDGIATVIETPTGRTLYVNGNANTAPVDRKVRSLNALIPLSLHPSPRRAFVIGLGAGLSTGLLAQVESLESVEVAEISDKVIEALPFFDAENWQLSQRMQKVQIIHADAYKALRNRETQYDIVVSEPAHPWVAGVENLFAREFLQAVSDRLSPGGIYAQWFPLFGVDSSVVLTVINTFHQVFPEVTIWTTAPGVIAIIVSNRPLNVDRERLSFFFEKSKKVFESVGFRESGSILGLQSLNQWGVQKLIRDFTGLHTLEFPQVGFRSARAYFVDDSVDYDQLLVSTLQTATGGEDADLSLLHERSGGLSRTERQDAIRFLRSSGITRSTLARLEYQYYFQIPSDKFVDRPPGYMEEYRYLAETSFAWPGGKSPDGTVLQRMIGKFRILTSAFLPAHLSKLLRLVPDVCPETDRACFAAKLDLLAWLPKASSRLGEAQKLDYTQASNLRALETIFRESL
ncbi:MAG: fused MFS/spermidine synthase [Bacteriovoracia bacterium]